MNKEPIAGESVLAGRVRQFIEDHPFLSDVAPVVVLAAIAVAGSEHDGLSLLRVVLAAGLTLPLLLRRRAPVVVFGVVAVVAFVQYLLNVRFASDVALLVALYAVASKRNIRTTAVAALVLETGVAMAALRWAEDERLVMTFVLLSGMTIAAVVGGVNVRTRRAYLLSVEDRAKRLERERESQTRLAVADERARIAREMHDVVTHTLSVMVALADGAGYALERSPEQAGEAISHVAETGRSAIGEMRRLLGVLHSEDDVETLAPQPGVSEIDALLDQVRMSGVQTGYEISGRASVPLNAGAQLTIYRIIQESLTNSIKHGSNVTRIDVQLAYGHNDCVVTVVNDGGIVSHGEVDGHGVAGMRARAALYNGTVEAAALPSGGWQVVARLDLVAAVSA